MTKKELKGRLHAELMHTAQEFVRAGQVNEDFKAGGITVFGPNYLKVKLVDKDYKPHSYTITIQEDRK